MLIDWLHPKWLLLPQIQRFQKRRKKNKRGGEHLPHEKEFARKIDKYLNKLNLILEALADMGEDAGPRVNETLQRHLTDGRFLNLHHLHGKGPAAAHSHHGHGHQHHHHHEHHAKTEHHHEHHKPHTEKHKHHKSHTEQVEQFPGDDDFTPSH